MERWGDGLISLLISTGSFRPPFPHRPAGNRRYFPYARVSLGGLTLAISTTAGTASLIIGVLLIVLAGMMWFQPQLRIFAGAATIVLTLISFPLSNLGGFFLGLITGLVGGSLACSWAPLNTTTAGRGDSTDDGRDSSDTRRISLRS